MKWTITMLNIINHTCDFINTCKTTGSTLKGKYLFN